MTLPAAVCTVELGACDTNPCCPYCAQCHGLCEPTTLSAEITSAEAWADMMPGGPRTVVGRIELLLLNGGVYPVTDVEILKGRIIVADTGIQLAGVIWGAETPFSGSVAPGGSATVSLRGNNTLAADEDVPCGDLVTLWAEVQHFAGARIEVTSKPVKLGCAY